ncbi:MAG: hypothetical protein Greene071436_360, partial [Parcubacteria group bacterium Greene0714_36]
MSTFFEKLTGGRREHTGNTPEQETDSRRAEHRRPGGHRREDAEEKHDERPTRLSVEHDEPGVRMRDTAIAEEEGEL